MVMSPTTPTSAAVNAAVAATSQQGAAVSQQQPSTIMRSSKFQKHDKFETLSLIKYIPFLRSE